MVGSSAIAISSVGAFDPFFLPEYQMNNIPHKIFTENVNQAKYTP